MKKLLTILFCLSFVFSFGQKSGTQVPSGNPTNVMNGYWYSVNKYVSLGDSGVLLPRRDTNWLPLYAGAQVFWLHTGVDSAVWTFDGLKWSKGAAGSGAGTVFSIATNDGTGIHGGTITTTGTLYIDTFNIATRGRLYKAVDSLALTSSTQFGVSDITMGQNRAFNFNSPTYWFNWTNVNDRSFIDSATSNLILGSDSIERITSSYFLPNVHPNACISGCTVTPVDTATVSFTYIVAASIYYINNVIHTSPQATITLTAADATNNRIDLFVLQSNNTATAITGTPDNPALQPDYNANTQLPISFATVPAGATHPTNTTTVIYKENAGTPTEFAAASNSANINVTSTNNPYAGSKDVEFTTAATNNAVTYTWTGAIDFSTVSDLNYKIRSKGSFGANKKIRLQWFNGVTPVGVMIPFGNGSYGFASGTTGSYQNITIPLSDFGNITGATLLKMTVSNTSGTLGCYIDNIILINDTSTNNIGILTVLGVTPISVSTFNNTAQVSLINSGVTAATYGDATHVGQFTVNAKGLVTAASSVTLTATVSSFSAGNLSPLFTTSVATATTTPALTFSLSNAAGGTVFGNNGSSSAAPAYTSTPVLGIAGTTLGTLGFAGNTSGVVTVNSAAAAGTWTLTLPTTGGTNLFFLQTNGSGGSTWAAPFTLTTTGTSGAATFLAGTLNIPQYAGGVSSVSDDGGGTLTVSPTTGAVLVGIALGHANTWTGNPTFSGVTTTFSGNVSTASNFGTTGIAIAQTAATYTSTTSSGTVASTGVNTFAQPTLAASSSTTLTSAATVYIANAPTAGTNVTITNPYTLLVAAGNSIFAGGLGTNMNGNANGNFYSFGGGTSGSNSQSGIQFGGSTNVNVRALFNGTTSTTASANNSVANVIFGAVPITEASSGTHAIIANAAVLIPTVTNGSATTTDATSLYIQGAPTGITPTNTATALWIAGGMTRLGGTVGINTTTASAQLHVIQTTEQLRLGYDASNYMSVTTGSTGSTTFTLTGTSPVFGFSNNVGIGTSTATALFQVAGGISLTAANIINGSVGSISAQTITDNTSSGSVTLQSFGAIDIQQPTFTTTNVTTYLGNYATLRIANAPARTGNLTMSGNAYALLVTAGTTQLQATNTAGLLTASSGVTVSGSNLSVTSPGLVTFTNSAGAAAGSEVNVLGQYTTTQTSSFYNGMVVRTQSQAAGSTTQNIGNLYGIVSEIATRASTATALGNAEAFQAVYYQSTTQTQKATKVVGYRFLPLGSTPPVSGSVGDQTVQIIATGGNAYGLLIDSSNAVTYGAAAYNSTSATATFWGVYVRPNSGNLEYNQLTFTAIGAADGTVPTSRLLIGAGSATANTAPLGFTSGTLETTARAGTKEYNNSFYATKNSTLRYGEGGTIADFTSDVNNSGTAETDIYTYTTPASTLAATGEKLMADFTGTFNDITATGQLQVYFGGTLIGNTGALTISATGAWVVKVMVIRTGSTTARASVNVSTPGGSTALYTAETDITGLTFTNTNIIKITGTAGGAGGGSSDITGKLGTIAWFPAAAN